MPIAEPRNIGLLSSLPKPEQAQYASYVSAMQRVEARNPAMDTGVYTAFLENWLAGAVEHRQHMIETQRTALQQDGHVRPSEIRAESRRIRNNFEREFVENVLPHYGAEGADAMRKLKREVNPSVFGNLFKQVYDSDKGGLQIGGIAGLVGGALLGHTLGGGFKSWMGIAAMVAGAIAGSWVGNKASDMVSNALNKDKRPSPAPGHGLSHEHGAGLSSEVSEEAQRRHEAARRAVDAGHNPSTPESAPSEQNLGELPSQQGPQPNRQQGQGAGQGTSTPGH